MAVIHVLCAGAAKSAFLQSVEAFNHQGGGKVVATFAAVGTLVKMLEAGEAADMVVLNSSAVAKLLASGKLRGTAVPLGTVGVALAVKEGGEPVDVSTAEKLRGALLDAPSLAYGDPAHGDSSGIHFQRVLHNLGLELQLADRIVLAASGLAVAEAVRNGVVSLGATQSSVIRASEGVVLAAMLPDGLQQWTTYTAALTSSGVLHESALQLFVWMQGEPSRALFTAAGFVVPAGDGAA